MKATGVATVRDLARLGGCGQRQLVALPGAQGAAGRPVAIQRDIAARHVEQCSEATRRTKKVARRKPRIWARAIRPIPPGEAEKQAIIEACEAFIRDVLKPRFLPEIRPTEWNYVVDIHGMWTAGRYRFIQRYRSGMEHNRGEEFDAPFARIDRMGVDDFDIHWMRHTGKWWPLYRGVTLVGALRILETDGTLHPI